MEVFKKPKRKVNKVYIHCSATDRQSVDVEEVRRWHKKRKWVDIGYHYFIKSDGTLQVGRTLEKQPASQYPFNKATISICLNGLVNFNNEQFETLCKLCVEIDKEYLSNITFHGHREVNKNKTCPVFDYKHELNLNSAGFIKLNL